jgi:hypothetical protein
MYTYAYNEFESCCSQENVAVVEFNASARIVQHLSTDYFRCRRAVDSLKAGGQTAMLDGLLESLKEILQNGGIVRVCGLAMTPRIILMTDGEPTDSAGSVEGKKKVVAAALGFGPGWRQLGLPHPVPIACVGCGSCDTELLEAIAKITNGMYVIVGNVTELSTFFRRQVLLIRFAMQFAADMERLQSQIALAAFLQELGEAVEEAELEAMMTLLLAMLVTSGDGAPRSVGSSGRPAIMGPSARVPAPLQPLATTPRPTASTGPLAIQASSSSTTTSAQGRLSSSNGAQATPAASSTSSSAKASSGSSASPRTATTSTAVTRSTTTGSMQSSSISTQSRPSTTRSSNVAQTTTTTSSTSRVSANASSGRPRPSAAPSHTAATSTAVVRSSASTSSTQRQRGSGDGGKSCILQ